MGAKTALLAFTDGDLRPTLSGAVRSDPAEVIDRVRQLHPGYEVTPIGDGSLILEGRPAPDDVDPDDVHLHGFRVADPTGREQADREAVMARALQSMGPPRRYRMMPDGTLQEID
jgi:hypothetical protein